MKKYIKPEIEAIYMDQLMVGTYSDSIEKNDIFSKKNGNSHDMDDDSEYPSDGRSVWDED